MSAHYPTWEWLQVKDWAFLWLSLSHLEGSESHALVMGFYRRPPDLGSPLRKGVTKIFLPICGSYFREDADLLWFSNLFQLVFRTNQNKSSKPLSVDPLFVGNRGPPKNDLNPPPRGPPLRPANALPALMRPPTRYGLPLCSIRTDPPPALESSSHSATPDRQKKWKTSETSTKSTSLPPNVC